MVVKIYDMNKILVFIAVAVSSVLFGQSTRFIYEVRMTPNINDKSEQKVENAYLDVSGQSSLFVSENQIKRDSVMQRMRETRNFSMQNVADLRSIINYTIEKDLSSSSVTYKERIGRQLYSYQEDRELEWEILPETAKLGDYQTQKAKTTFGGREWYAWFTLEIPLHDGPYKFNGLPGLIIKVEDEEGDYSFDLKESKSISSPTIVQTRGSEIKLKRSDFEKQKAKYIKDPVAFMQASSGGRGGRMSIDPQRAREMQNRMRQEVQNLSNPIELNK